MYFTSNRDANPERYFVFYEDGSGYNSARSLKGALEYADIAEEAGEKVTIETRIYTTKEQ